MKQDKAAGTDTRKPQCYADDADDELVADAIQAIGYIARVVPEATAQCLSALMSFIQSKHGEL